MDSSYAIFYWGLIGTEPVSVSQSVSSSLSGEVSQQQSVEKLGDLRIVRLVGRLAAIRCDCDGNVSERNTITVSQIVRATRHSARGRPIDPGGNDQTNRHRDGVSL